VSALLSVCCKRTVVVVDGTRLHCWQPPEACAWLLRGDCENRIGAVVDHRRHGWRFDPRAWHGAFQVPTRIFITEALPKGPTGKVQRRFMVDAFINKKQEGASGKGGVQKNATAGGGAAASPSSQGEPPLPRPPRSRL